MTMNDAYIYCTKEQIKEEFKNVVKMHDEVYKILGLKDYVVYMRTELDLSSENVSTKMCNAQLNKIPNVLIIGKKEVNERTNERTNSDTPSL